MRVSHPHVAHGGRCVSSIAVIVVVAALWSRVEAQPLSKSLHFPLSDPTNRQNWTVYPPMTDEFDGNGLDDTKWASHSPGWPGRAPGLFDPANVVVTNGTLQLWARAARRNSSWPPGFDNYTTSAVHSVATTARGYFEIRSRSGSSCISSSWWFHFNDGQGTWTEIDVFETSGAAPGMPGCLAPPAGQRRDHEVPSHQHIFSMKGISPATLPQRCNCTFGKQGTQEVCSSQSWLTTNYSVSEDFHVYGLMWNASHLTFFVDGQQTGSLPAPCLSQPIGMDFDRETMPDWMGAPQRSLLPDVPFTIDYVRAWKAPLPGDDG